MKIAVLGYSGAGKSTLARALSSALPLPCLHLDQVHWLPGWTERAQEESRQIVEEFLEQNTSWIIDGNYSGLCLEERLEQADHIAFLNFPRLRCLWRTAEPLPGALASAPSSAVIQTRLWCAKTIGMCPVLFLPSLSSRKSSAPPSWQPESPPSLRTKRRG